MIDSCDPPEALEGSQKSLERQIRAYHWIRLLAELPGRLAGSAEEREAAERVASWLRDVGFEEIELEPVASAPHRGGLLAVHLLLGALGCALGGVLGFALVVLAAASLRRELAGSGSPLARGLPASDSVVVSARAGAERPRHRIVLLAALDATSAGRIFSAPLVRLLGRRGGRGDEPLPGVLAWSGLALASVVAGALALGADSALAEASRWLASGALAVGAVLGIEWLRAPASPGANHDASGVAALLTCAEQLLARLPPDVELWGAATGASEVGSRGLRALLDAHPEWLSDRTAFVSFEGVGAASLAYARSGGELAPRAFPPMLVELARRVAASGAFRDVTPADVASSDGAIVARRGGQVLVLVSRDPDGSSLGKGSLRDLPENLEMETVVRAADFASAVMSAVLRGDAAALAYV